MSASSSKQELVPVDSDSCLICDRRKATCNNYGVLSCDACKMFFRRSVIERLHYICKKNKSCLMQLPKDTKPICRGCRLQKCFELGMQFFPQSLHILQISNRKTEDFMKVLRDLTAMSSSWYLKLLNFYTEDDPSLKDILDDRKVEMKKKSPQQVISPDQWAFFANYILVSSFTNFPFVQSLSDNDKIKLFQSTAIKLSLLCSSMRALKDRRDTISTPDGQEVYPDAFVSVLKVDPMVLKRLCSLLAVRMIELEVKDEEFILLLLIFFCNPGSSDPLSKTVSFLAVIPSLSSDAQNILAPEQQIYASALFQHCQIEYQTAAPSRFTDLLSLIQIVHKVFQDLQYITMIFQCSVPDFKFFKLAIDTLDLSENRNNVKVEEDD